MKKRVADIIIESLVEHGITDCFGVVGGGAMFLDNALALNDNINKYFNHHEQASALAAEGYARTSGRMAAVCVTSGPGVINTLTGVQAAYVDSLPMIVLSGQVRYAISVEQSGLPLRYRGVQEYQIVKSAEAMTKYAVMLKDPLSVKREMHKAIQIALEGRRGPVLLDVPQDVQSAMVEEDELYPVEEYVVERGEADYNKLVEALKNAKRPCLLTGTGIRNGGAHKEFMEFAEKLQIPVVGGYCAMDSMYLEHPLFFGQSGLIGPRTGNFILQNADVILSLGNSLGFKQTGFYQEGFAPNANIIMVEADECESRKPGLRVDQLIHRDLATFFKEVAQYDLPIGTNQEWMDYCVMLRNRFSPYEALEGLKKDERVNSYHFWKLFAEHAKEDSICSLGANSANSAIVQIGVTKSQQRLLPNSNSGPMGCCLPYAIGGAVASGKEVYCVTGDGSVMMNLQELQTIRHYNLPVKVVIFSNDGYGTIRQTCKNFFNGKLLGCNAESGISFPNFGEVAKAFGFEYMHCRTNEELDTMLPELIAHPGHVLMEIDQLLDNPVSPKLMSRFENGKMQTPALHDMAPFISKEELEELMQISQ